MVYKQVLFEDNMEAIAVDFNNTQAFIGQSINEFVFDAFDYSARYVGMGISKVGITQVQVNTGRLYWAGVVYELEDPYIIDFQTVPGAMPVTQQRQVAIIAAPQVVSSDLESRNFVIDPDSGQTQTESVSMWRQQVCNINTLPGVESPSPSFPTVPNTNLLIGYVLLSTEGVVTIQQSTNTQLPNLADQDARLGTLEIEFGLVANQILTLQNALAALAADFGNYCTLTAFNKLVDLVNWIVQQLLKPAAYVLDSIDNFYDTSQSAVGTTLDGLYNAQVSEGIRFGVGATQTTALALANNSEPTIQAYVMITGGTTENSYILPKPSGMRIRMDCGFPDHTWDVEPLLNHPMWPSFTPRRLGWARYRHRCGPTWTPVSIGPQSASAYDPIYYNLRFDTDTWVSMSNGIVVLHDDDDPDYPRWLSDRWQYYWRDYVDRDYWSKVSFSHSYSHNLMGQSFLNAQDGWLGGITVWSMVASYFQPLAVVISECDANGKPKPNRTLGKIELSATDIQACYGAPVYAGDIISGSLEIAASMPNVAVWTGPDGYFRRYPVYAYPLRINFNPVFLAAGKRYHFHLSSTSAHQFAVSLNPVCYQTHGGDFWEYDGFSDWHVFPGGPRTLRFMLHYLTWGNWAGQAGQVGGQLRYPVQLRSLQLAGGIASIDVLADAIVPPTTDLNYAIQVRGVWQTFNYDPNAPSLTGNAPLLPFEAIFTGTSDLMPGLSIVNSQVKLQGPSSSGFHHISTSIPCSATTAGIKVLVNVTNWTSHHSLDCHVHYGSTTRPKDGLTGPILLPDGITNQFTYTFNVGAGVTNYQIELDGSSDGTGDNFVVHQRSSFHQ